MRPRGPSALLLALCALLLGSGLAACGGGGGGGELPVGPIDEGAMLAKPDGGLYIVDRHAGGRASRPRLVEVFWGRLVDVHGLSESGEVLTQPSLRDLVVSENLLDEAGRWRLETNPITRITRLIVLRAPGAPDAGDGTFADLVRQATAGLAGVEPRAPGVSSGYTYVARNAALVLHFDDLLDDSPEALAALDRCVQVVTGYPPVTPFEARTFFDPNHGGIAGGEFHSTRVLVDLTVSEAEAATSPVPRTVNSVGLPASDEETATANVSLYLPTRTDPGSGQFDLLTNLAGSPLDAEACRPFDETRPTRDVVRAVRSGGEDDVNNGFLLDFVAPRLVGTWPCRVEAARPLDTDGARWSLDVRFGTVCRKTPERGDVVAVGERFLEVSGAGVAIDADGGVRLEAVAVGSDLPSAPGLLGNATYRSLYVPTPAIQQACWLRFDPPPRAYPGEGVSPDATVTLRFSEPMDPASFRPFDTLMVVAGATGTPVGATSLVVGSLDASPGQLEVTFQPSLPFAHAGNGRIYHVRQPVEGGVTDLAGNQLAVVPEILEFSIDRDAPRFDNGALVLRFESLDEMPPFDARDLRGQFTYDFPNGRIRPRPVVFASKAVEPATPLIAQMGPFGPGVVTPLSPLGSKLQTVWRYADFGWTIRDETNYNLDVVGLSWSPADGAVVADFFERLEVWLAHSNRLPDERVRRRNGFAVYPLSGLRAGPAPFTENVLADPRSPQTLMNPRDASYRIRPIDLDMSPAGTPLMPWPVNRDGGDLVTFTWRDTSVIALGGDNGAGVPLDVEGFPIGIEPTPGTFAGPGFVDAVGLPLLMEFRCYPTASALGLNPLSIRLGSQFTADPNFRAYSTGGFAIGGERVVKNPDLETYPTGGFNPSSLPPGRPTKRDAENSMYMGSLDYVIRVSRVHTAWFDTEAEAPTFGRVVLEPDPSLFPSGTRVELAYRGAVGFDGPDPLAFFDAERLTPIGDSRGGSAIYHDATRTWKSDVRGIDGARYVQIRISFVSNILAGITADLSAVGLPYTR